MQSLPELLAKQLEHRQRAIDHLVEAFTAEEAQMTLHREGPCADGLLWHLAHVGHSTLLALGGSADPVAEPGLYPASKAEFQRIALALREHTQAMAAEQWASPPAIEVLPAFRDKLKTRADFLSGHIFHLAYHAGQLGSLRSKWGVTGA